MHKKYKIAFPKHIPKNVNNCYVKKETSISRAFKNENPNKSFCGYRHTDSKVYMEWQTTQNNQHNIEKEEQSWRAGMTQLHEHFLCFVV